jgi:tellurite resistance protein
MLSLSKTTLESLRDQLRARGQRPSIVLAMPPGPASSKELIDAMRIVEEWGAFVEAMYLVMAADKRVLNVEREVVRGALSVLSDDTVRTRHMEAMLDAAMRKVAEEGADKRLDHVIEQLRGDPARAESAAIVGAAVAAADQRFPPEEHAVLAKLFAGLGIGDERAEKLLSALEAQVGKAKT